MRLGVAEPRLTKTRPGMFYIICVGTLKISGTVCVYVYVVHLCVRMWCVWVVMI